MGSLVNNGIRVIYGAILLAPVFGVYQYLSIFPWGQYDFVMPWYYKGSKDILLVLVYALFLTAIIMRRRFRISWLLSSFLLYVFVSLLLNLAVLDNWLITMVGARSLFSLLLAFFSFSFFPRRAIYSLAKCVVYVAVLMVPLSIIQFLYGNHIHGTIFGHYASRVAATFVQPSSLGIFLVLAVYFVRSYPFRNIRLLTGIFALTIFLTGSGISILGLMFVVVITMPKNRISYQSKALLLPAVLLVLLGLLYVTAVYLPAITYRPDIFLSAQGRYEIIRGYFADNLSAANFFFGKGLGYGTNSLYTVFPELGREYGFIPDSMYISMIAQLGVFGLLFFLYINAYAYFKSNSTLKHSIPVLLFSGMTVNILELYPVNWIYPIVLGVLLRNDSPSIDQSPSCAQEDGLHLGTQ